MTKTTNYQLPQWEATDPICRADLNAAMGAIDEGMRAAAELPYVVGMYTGNGETLTISVGFRPSLVIIGKRYQGDDEAASYGACYVYGDGEVVGAVAMTDDGFTVTREKTYPAVNWQGILHYYIAFR